MNNLRDSSAKPRTKVRAPGYPRLLKAGLVAVLAACGGEVAPADGDGSNSLMNGDNGEQVEPDAGTSDPIMGGGMLPPYDEGDKGQDGTGGNPGWGDPEYGGGIGASYDPNEKGEGGTGGDPEEWPDVAGEMTSPYKPDAGVGGSGGEPESDWPVGEGIMVDPYNPGEPGTGDGPNEAETAVDAGSD